MLISYFEYKGSMLHLNTSSEAQIELSKDRYLRVDEEKSCLVLDDQKCSNFNSFFVNMEFLAQPSPLNSGVIIVVLFLDLTGRVSQFV